VILDTVVQKAQGNTRKTHEKTFEANKDVNTEGKTGLNVMGIMEKKSDSNILHDKQQFMEELKNKEKVKEIPRVQQTQLSPRPPSTPRKKSSTGRVLGIGD
jgi:hypothetical protein